jgi:hypothetical protein
MRLYTQTYRRAVSICTARWSKLEHAGTAGGAIFFGFRQAPLIGWSSVQPMVRITRSQVRARDNRAEKSRICLLKFSVSVNV